MVPGLAAEVVRQGSSNTRAALCKAVVRSSSTGVCTQNHRLEILALLSDVIGGAITNVNAAAGRLLYSSGRTDLQAEVPCGTV